MSSGCTEAEWRSSIDWTFCWKFVWIHSAFSIFFTHWQSGQSIGEVERKVCFCDKKKVLSPIFGRGLYISQSYWHNCTVWLKKLLTQMILYSDLLLLFATATCKLHCRFNKQCVKGMSKGYVFMSVQTNENQLAKQTGFKIT